MSSWHTVGKCLAHDKLSFCDLILPSPSLETGRALWGKGRVGSFGKTTALFTNPSNWNDIEGVFICWHSCGFLNLVISKSSECYGS
jgi:hypothetical protein